MQHAPLVAYCDAVKIVNRACSNFVDKIGWKLVRHGNIAQKGLKNGGLHLNREGNELLQRNFVNFVKNN